MLEEPTDPRSRLALEVSRIHDRLRSMSPERLEVAIPEHGTRAAAAYALARWLALAAEGIEQRAVPDPVFHELPVLPAASVSDQVAVCGHDLLLALEGVDDDEQVWSGLHRVPLRQVIEEVLIGTRALRLLL